MTQLVTAVAVLSRLHRAPRTSVPPSNHSQPRRLKHPESQPVTGSDDSISLRTDSERPQGAEPRVSTAPEITGPVIVPSSVKNFCSSVIGALAT
jgi:hypothetical protein